MSKYDNNQHYYEKDARSSIRLMKIKVTVGLCFFKKIEIEKEEREVTGIMEKELKQWSMSKGYNFSIRKVERSSYIRGHAAYLLPDTRHCKILSFSR